MQVELIVTLWESNAGDLILTLDADAGGRGSWTFMEADFGGGAADDGAFKRDADELIRNDIGHWTVPIRHMPLDNPPVYWGSDWRVVAEYDGYEVTMLADRVGGSAPGRAAARYLGSAVPA